MKSENEDKKQLKVELGQLIKSNREAKGDSQRELAREIKLANSNLKYIEDGINAPSPEVYKKIILLLKPDYKDRGRMDNLYSQIRGTPPPDICEFMIENAYLYDVLRSLDNNYKKHDIQTKILNEVIFDVNKGE